MTDPANPCVELAGDPTIRETIVIPYDDGSVSLRLVSGGFPKMQAIRLTNAAAKALRSQLNGLHDHGLLTTDQDIADAVNERSGGRVVLEADDVAVVREVLGEMKRGT